MSASCVPSSSSSSSSIEEHYRTTACGSDEKPSPTQGTPSITQTVPPVTQKTHFKNLNQQENKKSLLFDMPFWKIFEAAPKAPEAEMPFVIVSPDISFAEYRKYISQKQLPISNVNYDSYEGRFESDIDLAAAFYRSILDPSPGAMFPIELLMKFLEKLQLRTFNAFFKCFTLRSKDTKSLDRICSLIIRIRLYQQKAPEPLMPEYEACIVDLFQAHRHLFRGHEVEFLWTLFLNVPELISSFAAKVLNAPEDMAKISYDILSFILTTDKLTLELMEKFEKYILPLPQLDLNCHDGSPEKVPFFSTAIQHGNESLNGEKKNACCHLLRLIIHDPRFKMNFNVQTAQNIAKLGLEKEVTERLGSEVWESLPLWLKKALTRFFQALFDLFLRLLGLELESEE